MPVSSLIVGVDLDKIKPIRGCKTLVGDITTPATAAALRRASGGASFDAVLHDGAPNVGGAWSAEAYGQSALVLDAAKLAVAMLAPGGTFVTKVFRSKDYTALLYAFRQLFDKVDATKPASSRSTSAEIFVVCRGFKAPAKLDPRLLDARCLFVDGGAVAGAGGGAEPEQLNEEGLAVEAAIGPAALLGPKGAKRARHRSGYDDGASTLRRTAPAASFVRCQKPVEVLGRYTALLLDGPGSRGEASDVASGAPGPGSAPSASDADAAAVAAHPATTAEIRLLAADLGVLGRSEFKALLKWRSVVRATLLRADKEALAGASKEAEEEEEEAAEEAEEKKEAGSGGEEGESDDGGEGGVLDEIADAKARADARLKKEKKRAREAKKKARIRAAQIAAGEGVLDDGGAEGLFSLAAVRAGAGKEAHALTDAPVPDNEDDEDDDESAGGSKKPSRRAAASQGSDSEFDSDDSEERRSRYELETERALDDAYGSYLERARGRRDATAAAAAAAVRNAAVRRGGKRAKLGDGAGELGGDGESDDDDEETRRAPSGYEIAVAESDSDDSGLDDGPAARGGGLLVPLSKSSAAAQAVAARRGTAAAADRWFGADPLFAADDEDDDDALAAAASAAAAAAKAKKKSKEVAVEGEGGVARAPRTPPAKSAAVTGGGAPVLASPSAAAAAAAAVAGKDDDDGFEVMPGRASDDSDFPWTDDESEGEEGEAKKRKKKKESFGGDENGNDEEDSDAGLGSMHPSERAEVLALARAALRGRRRSDIVDAGYNRYAFNDGVGSLPRWFANDECRHSRPAPLVSREEVAAESEAARGAAARPIKKVAQAKARKAHRLSVRLDAARRKAEAVAGSDELGARGKAREVERIMSRARAGKGARGSSSSRKQSRSATISGQKKAKPIDGRMRADMKRGKKGAKGGKGKAGGGGGGKRGKGRR